MSIKKIAELAGVSPSTVSRVLNNPNYKCSSPGLREKIWKTARELNYVPNEAARNLRKGAETEQSFYIQVLMTRTDSAQSDPFYTEVLRVIESEIHRQMCILSEVWYQPIFSNDKKCKIANLDRIVSEMREGQDTPCDGLIVIGRCDPEALKRLKKTYKNVVSVNRNSTNFEVDEVNSDGKKIASLAVDQLIKKGHTKIGYVGACHNEMRYNGFCNTLRNHGLEVYPDYVIETGQTQKEGYKAMERFAKMDDAPTGVYCANDITAIGMITYMNRFKKRYYTPAIISSDDIEEAQYTNPMLTTVALPKEEMGRFAIFLLLDRIRGGHKNNVQMEMEGKLVMRESCTSVEDSYWCEYYI